MKSKYSEEKIVQIIAEAAAREKALNFCRKYGFRDASFFNRKNTYGRMTATDVKRSG